MERLSEIHNKEDETATESGLNLIPGDASILINNLSFQYEGPHSRPVLKDINMELEKDSVTAIVGRSGSGKTTLVKLLLAFYQPVSGEIRIGDQGLKHLPSALWRERCGVVMQDGYIFGDSIAKNIALGHEQIDVDKLMNAAKLAAIDDFIDQLPLGYNTRIGGGGLSLSGGEKQRILIARAIYNDPDFLFIDEGTSSLDAENERRIMENLKTLFKGKTVVIIAHRLSTVKEADQIVVLEKGNMVEKGSHGDLVKKKGAYFSLVQNQLELGN